MTSKKGNQETAVGGGKGTPQPTRKQKPTYATRYIAVDSHLTERNGSTDSVFGLAGERPAGRKLAQDVANACNQLDSEGYEVISIVPLTSGRIVEATIEAEERVQGRTFSKNVAVEREPANPSNGFALNFPLGPQYEQKHYVDTAVGYSVTDGVVITAKRRN